jgi:hypothetical protein
MESCMVVGAFMLSFPGRRQAWEKSDGHGGFEMGEIEVGVGDGDKGHG